jgi:hypothetical protein
MARRKRVCRKAETCSRSGEKKLKGFFTILFNEA